MVSNLVWQYAYPLFHPIVTATHHINFHVMLFFTSFDEQANNHMKNPPLRKFFLSWLLHFCTVWTISNVYDWVSYELRVAEWGTYIINEDGTPVTQWQRFVNHNNWHQPGMLLLALVLLCVEVNYHYLFKRLRLPWFIICCLLISVGCYFVFALLYIHNAQKLSNLNSDALSLLIIAVYALVYALVRDYFYQSAHRKEVQLQQSENELNALKAQLNPHFLFNSLNYLYGTALKENAPLTADGVDSLSQMMRYTITGLHHNFVPVKEELTFLEHYIAMQRVRLPQTEGINIQVQMVNPVPHHLEIAPLILLPFVENAFKYGISMDAPCTIGIQINLTGSELTLKVQNQVIAGHAQVKGNNTGIKNTIKRLQLLYPDTHHLEIQNTGDQYKIKLTLQLNPNNS
ncbi:sensor histidine kinase [Mucilaginibacter terrae]|uniref:sensor histidine kinase n=1 Tax=Mucilaginibacter terrae TaxID=1955052 RepID=UPI003633FDA1